MPGKRNVRVTAVGDLGTAQIVVMAGRSHRAPATRHTGNDWTRGYDRALASTTKSPRPLAQDDPRLSVPLFTLRESAAYLHTPVSTLHAWAHPQEGEPLVTVFPRAGRRATVPFVGFAEAFVLGALRGAGVPMQRVRPAVAKLSAEIGLDHALASQRVYTDGAEVIFDYAESSGDEDLLTVVRTGQQHFAESSATTSSESPTATTAGPSDCDFPHTREPK